MLNAAFAVYFGTCLNTAVFSSYHDIHHQNLNLVKHGSTFPGSGVNKVPPLDCFLIGTILLLTFIVFGFLVTSLLLTLLMLVTPLSKPIDYSHKLSTPANLALTVDIATVSVEVSAVAGIPSCPNLYELPYPQILPDSEDLELLRESWETGVAIEWVKVHDLPEYTYFSIMLPM